MDKVDIAIKRLQEASQMSQQVYQKPLIVRYSGGKDSDVVLELAKLSKVPFVAINSHTTADAPETVRFIKRKFRKEELDGVKCEIVYPVFKGERTSMWDLIVRKTIPPTRMSRYCCSVLKETVGKNRFIATGVRHAESKNREGRGIIEEVNVAKDKRVFLSNDNDDRRSIIDRCVPKSSFSVNPIIDWSDSDVWDFIKSEEIEHNPLYCEFSRVGCIGCPLASNKMRNIEFSKWPKYKNLYLLAFKNMLEERKRRGKIDNEWRIGDSAIDIYHWWMEDGVLPGQMNLFDDMEDN